MLKIFPSQDRFFVSQDGQKAVQSVVHVSETPTLSSAVHESDGLLAKQVSQELGHHPGASFLGGRQAVQTGPIQLKGRMRVKRRSLWSPMAQMTRSSNCLAHA